MDKKVFVIVIVVLVAIAALLGGASVAYSILTSPENSGGTPGNIITGTGSENGSGQANQSGQNNQANQAQQNDSQLAPDFAFLDRQGNTVKLSDFRGKPVVLNMWASWCPPCVGEMPDFEQAYLDYGSDINFIMLNSTDGQRETIEIATQFVNEQGFTFPLYFDAMEEGFIAYNANSIPRTFFIDADGNLLGSQVGSMSASKLRNNIEQMIR